MIPTEAEELEEAIAEQPPDWRPAVQRLVQAEVKRLRARSVELETALRQADDYCARPPGVCFPRATLGETTQ